MAIFKCKMCGGTLEINNNETVAVCEYCGTKQTLPKLDDDRRANMYDRANHFRRENEFDKAMGIYEMILSDDKEDCESYWGIVLCRYGIEYVEDPRTHKRIPTVNRAQFTSIFDDEDYKNAIKYADGYQKDVYEAEAGIIDKIQKGILEISSKEEPFDVFICYKETDSHGNRTQESVYAQDIYTALTKEGYKVFFSRITLEDKLGSAYEPYIFAALNSAKVMLVVGTEKDNFNAVWVKNEWSRYISLIKAGKDKTLIPVYKDISPYDMPEEFQYLQSQDMGKIGFMQDLIRGISKLVETNKTTVKETVVVNNSNNTAPLLERVFMFLEDGDWTSADEYCEKVLDLDPKNAEAYLGKLMAQYNINKREDLRNTPQVFYKSINYQKAYKFANDNLKKELDYYVRVSELDVNCPVYGLEIERNSIEKQGVIRNLNIEKSSNNKRKVVIISSIVVVFLIIVISTIALISNREIESIDSNLSESISVQFSSSPKVIRAQTLNGTELGVSNVDSSRTFMANNTIDDNYDTCWCVNTDNTGGAGAEIAFILEEQTTIRRIGIINGNQFHTYDELYSLNGQICEFMLTFSDGSKQTFRADFNSGNPGNYQYFDIEPSVVTSSIVLTVISAYEGTKYSTNVAITEFEVY